MKKVNIYFADGFEEIEAISAIDVLRRASIDVNMVSVTGKKTVNGAHNIPVVCDSLYEEADNTSVDMLILPGGVGHKVLDAHSDLKKQLQSFAAKGKPIAAICAAPMILGKLGLLKGLKAVCYPGFEKFLEGAEILKDTPAVDSGTIITGAGPGPAINFALKIVERLVGKEKAMQLTDDMIVK